MKRYILFELDLTKTDSGQTVRLTNAPHDLVWNYNTFGASGDLLQIGSITDSADLSSVGLLVTLQGIDPSYQAEINANNFLKAPVGLFIGEVEDGSNEAKNVVCFHRGYADTPTTEVNYSESTITIGIETQSIIGELDRIPNIMGCSVSNHAARHNGDKFFEYTADSGTTELWIS